MKHDRIVLNDRQTDMIERLVRSGRFNSTTEVIGYSLDLLEQREAEADRFLSDLEQEATRGLDSGPASAMETAEELIAQFRERR